MRLALVVGGCIVGVVVLLVALAFFIGSRLPVDHTAARSLKLGKPPAEVYAVVRNFGDASAWRTDVKRVEVLANDRFREHGANGVVTYQIVSDIPAKQLVTQIMDLDLGYSGSWAYDFAPSAEGTILTITERGSVTNPLFRFMSRYVFGHTATIDGYLKSLDGRLRGL
jgi:hypothetical protein